MDKTVVLLKAKKCFPDSSEYPRHSIVSRRFCNASKTLSAVRDLEYPSASSTLRSFLGLCSIYRRLVPNFCVHHRESITTGRASSIRVNRWRATSGRRSKVKMIGPPVPTMLGPEKNLYMRQAHAIKKIGGAKLEKKEHDELGPVSFWCKRLLDTEYEKLHSPERVLGSSLSDGDAPPIGKEKPIHHQGGQ